MAVMAKWGKFKWKVNKKLVKPIGDLSGDFSYDLEKGKREKKSLTLPFTCYKALGGKPNEDLAWLDRNVGKAHRLYLGTTRFYAQKLILEKVSLSEVHAGTNGKIESMTYSLSFKEK